jgi:hypothetical protein
MTEKVESPLLLSDYSSPTSSKNSMIAHYIVGLHTFANYSPLLDHKNQVEELFQDRPSLVMVARSFKKSFTEPALKPSYQKTSLLRLRKELRFQGKIFAPARRTLPLCDQLCPYVTNSAPARPRATNSASIFCI